MAAETRRQPLMSTSTPTRQGIRFDWIISLFYCAFFFGVFLDAWAHSHGHVDDTFFTPWHAVMYGTFTGLALFVMRTIVLNYKLGQSLFKALPLGYGALLLGVGLFIVGGVGDLMWHTLFGIETDIEAIYSPSHLLLLAAMVLILGAPFRAAWLRRGDETPSLLQFFPALLSLVFMVSIIGVVGIPISPYFIPGALRFGGSMGGNGIGIYSAGMWIYSAVLIGAILFAMRRWRMPFGSLTFLFAAHSAILCVISDHFWFIPFAAAAGFAADLLALRLKLTGDSVNRTHFRLFAFIVPVILFSAVFAAVEIFMNVGWVIHVWAGTIVTTGFVGLLLSYLILPQPRPTE